MAIQTTEPRRNTRPDGGGDVGGGEVIDGGGSAGGADRPRTPPTDPGDTVETPPEDNAPPVKDTPREGPSQAEKDAAAARWTQDVLNNGTDAFLDALMRGDESAKLALQKGEFLTILQAQMNKEQQLLSTISNLLNKHNSTAMNLIGNLRG